ncbi:hypothetical protein V1291_004856 [Nitrobacteraceae bacterium AZCC 1564]
MNDHFLLMGGILAILLVALQAIASLNASREMNPAATESISLNSNGPRN